MSVSDEGDADLRGTSEQADADGACSKAIGFMEYDDFDAVGE